jgi:hypothetical protein
MSGLKCKCLAVAVVLLVSVAAVHCDDEKEMVCCYCECSRPWSDDVEIKAEYTSGEGISCQSGCTQKCQEEARWEFRSFQKIDCAQMPADTDAKN